MFSSVAYNSTIRCTILCRRNIPTKITVPLAFGVDVITGLALLIIGCLGISGIMPCNSIGGGFMIAAGCINLILAPLMLQKNCRTLKKWD